MAARKSERPPFSVSGFIIAASTAPALSVVLCFLGAAVATLSSSGWTGDWVQGLGSLLFLTLIVTLWGLVPSLVFGGLVLGLIHALPLRRWPPSVLSGGGGVISASLYILISELIDGIRPGAAFLFAPWTLMRAEASEIGGLWWVWLCIGSGGLGAGLIYAGFVKRG